MSFPSALGRFFNAGERDLHPGSGWASPAARRMFWTGLAVRLLYLTLAHTYRFRPADDHFQFGWEMGRIARALATGRGYADPFTGHTGPTAWTPPLYPLIMAAAFRVFGVYSNAAGWAVLAVNSLASAATAPAVYEIAARCYGRLTRSGNQPNPHAIALWSGWLWALYPAAMQYAVRWPWDMAVTVLFFTWTTVFALRLRGIGSSTPPHEPSSQTPTVPVETPGPPLSFPEGICFLSWRLWSLFGLFWGLIALSNSSLLTFLPFESLWILWPLLRDSQLRSHLAAVLDRALLAAVLFLICVGPWMLRNARTFHAFIPMRDNMGAELYESALPSHDGFPYPTVVPTTTSAPAWQQYARMGELAYTQRQRERARVMIASERPQFLRWMLFRVQFYWCGVPHPYDHGFLNEFLRELDFSFLSLSGLLGLALSMRRRVPGSTLFAMAFAVLPVLYYVVIVEARFRAPIEPLIAILATYLFRSANHDVNIHPPNKPSPK